LLQNWAADFDIIRRREQQEILAAIESVESQLYRIGDEQRGMRQELHAISQKIDKRSALSRADSIELGSALTQIMTLLQQVSNLCFFS